MDSTTARQQPAEQVLARSGRTFHLAARLLPQQARHDATELYAFCRLMDDLADDPGSGPDTQDRKNARAEALAHVIAILSRDPLGPEAEACGWPVELEARLTGISRVAVTLTQALAADVGSRRIADEPQLLQYAFGVAGTVGLMMCRILGAPPAAAQAAAHLGIAMQLSNIARDVGEDLQQDRIYLPASWVSATAVRAAVTSERASSLPRGAAAPPVAADREPLIAATRRLLALADQYYASADAGMPYLPRRARLGILAAAACYREIGVAVGRDIPASWRQRTVVAGVTKGSLVARALVRWLRPVRPTLHPQVATLPGAAVELEQHRLSAGHEA